MQSAIKRFGFASVMALAAPVAAQDITLNAPDTGPQITGLLESASLVLALDPDTNPAPQDYVAAARADYRALLTALYSAGYYSGTVSITLNGREAAGISPLAAPGAINTIRIEIDKGPKFTFGQARVAPLPPATELPDGFAPGEDAGADLIRQAALAGVTAWREAGHAKADVADQQIVARHAAQKLDASVRLAPGPRLTFGAVTVSGNADVRATAITRIAGLPEGAVYSPQEVEKAARRLRETGAFDSINLREAEAIGPGKTLPVDIQVVEALPRRIGFGIELSSVEGLKVSSYWLHRNFWGGAERLRVEGEVAGIGGGTGGTDYRIATSLTIPAIYGADTDLTFNASLSREDEPDYLLDKAAIEVIATRKLTDDLSASVGLGLLTAREETDLGVREYTLFTLPLSATYDKRDDPTNAQNGYYIDVDATPFVSLDGGANGGRLYVDARYYKTFGEAERFGIAARGQVGSVIGPDIAKTPADFLFYSGGSGTVRGQTYKSLGVETVAAGETTTTGGLSFIGAQVEARYGVTDSIGLVGFYDIGHVGATQVPGEDGDWHAGLGVGVRYNTGIGPIRLDVGTPANGDDAFSSVEVYIGIGQAF